VPALSLELFLPRSHALSARDTRKAVAAPLFTADTMVDDEQSLPVVEIFDGAERE